MRASGDIERTHPSGRAPVYAQLEEAGEAIDWLTRAAAAHEGGFAEAQVDPMLQPLASQEAFHILLARHRMQWQHASA